MTKQPFFSIIIPIYNVSRFIDSGIRYVLNQSFEDYEVILVDDGSTDGSGSICENLASNHKRIRCFHQSNAGSGPARNKGIEEARGDYIVFYDIDDSIEKTLLQECYDDLKSNSFPEMLIFSYDSYDVKYKSLVSSVFEPIKCESNDDVKRIYVDHLLGMKFHNGFVWNKVYSSSFLKKNNLHFPNLLIQQDEVFNTHVYRFLNTVSLSQRVLYHYKVYDKGNTRSQFIHDRYDIYNTVKKEFLGLYSHWSLDDVRMLEYIYRRFYGSIIASLNSLAGIDSSNSYYWERNHEMKSIMYRKETVDCVSKLQSLNIVPTKLVSWLYYKSIEKKSVLLYKALYFFDKLLELVKWGIKELYFKMHLS